MIKTPGIYDIPEDKYHADPCPEPSLSSSLARKIVTQSPLHAWTDSPRLNPDYQPKESEAFDIGRAFHSMLLEKGAGVWPVDADGWTTKAAREERDAARAEGKSPMLRAQYDAAQSMVEKARAALAGFKVELIPARNELAAIARLDGVWCRALIDHAPADPAAPLLDIKTCDDASPDACIRAVTSYGYDVQAAHYLDTWHAATGERRGFRFFFIEKKPPHECSMIELFDGRHIGDLQDPARAADWMEDAHDKARQARFRWRRCLDTGQWPGYPRAVAVIGAPSYYRSKWEGRAEPDPKPSQSATAAATAWQAPEGMKA